MPLWNGLGFQSSISNLMAQAEYFHDHTCLVLISILGLLFIINFDLLTNKVPMTTLTEHSTLELWWTIIPGFLLLFIAYPSLQLLYMMDEIEHPDMTLNTLGHQWYWEYNYPDFNSVMFDSYMTTSPGPSEIRLLDVDNRVVLPTESHIRVLVSSSDVLHSWAMPSLGVKVDAVPGRLNQLALHPLSPSITYGQCSEICGSNHSFMPIVLEFLPKPTFIEWLLNIY